MISMHRNVLFAGVAGTFMAAGGAASAAGTSTAQSVQVSIDEGTQYVITGSITYGFQRSVAATYFTNTLTSGPVINCTGGGAGGVNCLASNQPDTPLAPAPDPGKLNATVNSNSCTFFDGGVLGIPPGQTTYTQSTTLPGKNTRGNFKFEWTYTAAVDATKESPVSPITAWEIVSSEINSVPVAVSGFLAGQSTALKSSGAWTFKASHTMTDATGPRLTNGHVKLLDSGGNVLGDVLLVPGSLDEFGNPVPGNYTIEKNKNWTYSVSVKDPFADPPVPATYGDASQLFNDYTVNDIQNGIVAAPNGKSDNFAGNNGTGGERARFIDLLVANVADAGEYKLVLTGNLKGNDGGSAAAFGVTSAITISAGGCTVPTTP